MNPPAFVETSGPDLGLFGEGGGPNGLSPPFGPYEGRRRDAAAKRILLVEDDRGIRESLCSVLEDEGYAVALAENGREALDRLRANAAPDLIVLDLRMPVMDGWQFRAAQKRDPALANIPVLAISADGSAMAAAIDAQAYLRKPVSTASLLDTITRILGDDERRRLLGKLEEAERFAALGRLAASVGHEINNPLAYVSMNVEMAIEDLRRLMLNPQAAAAPPAAGDDPGGPLAGLLDMFQQCRIGVDRIRDVVKDLQKLSRARQVKRDPFLLNDLVDETLAIARNAVEHRARLRKEYAEVPPVMGDRSAMGQVLLNLLLNAAEALPEGLAHANQVSVRTYADVGAGKVIFEIEDTGPGIPPQVLPHIFDPFYTTKPIGEGTGLGLAVSLRIVADHGGHIDVDSKCGRGSVFRVVLPVTAPVAPAVARAGGGDGRSAARARGQARARVLIIDDVPAVARTIAASLAAEHDVTAVASVADAFVHLASGETFDVILCDLLMPDIGGRQFFERLIVERPQLAAKVIFMTGGAFTPESLEFIERSPQRVLIKPFAIDELKQLVRDQMQANVTVRPRDRGGAGPGN